MENLRGPGRGGRRPLSPARERVLRALAARSGGVTLAELARATGLHENTLRAHLAGLLTDRLVTRARLAPAGRGRPAWVWSVGTAAPDAGGYAGLATFLAHALAQRAPDAASVAREAGRAWGRSLAGAPRGAIRPDDARAAVVDLLDSVGFDPDPGGERGEIVLRACPMLEAAVQSPDVVCTAHLGLVEGAIESYGRGGTAVDLLPFATPATCTLRIGATHG